MRDRPLPVPSVLATRRRFLLGAAATTMVAACSSGSSGDESGDGGSSGDGGGDGGPVALDPNDLSVVRFFGPYFGSGAQARIPFGLSDSDGLLPTEVVPGNVVVSVRNPDGEIVAEDLTSVLHSDGLPRPYYSFEFTPATSGFYDFSFEVEGSEVISQFQVVEADDATIVPRVDPGDQMPAIETPTTEDARGVTPICTREPMCDLHGATVAELVGQGPMALLVATPAFCQTVVCGPILDVMLGVVPDYPDISFVHAEVFSDPANNEVPLSPDDFAPVIDELGLPYEPVLYVVGADGMVRDRLDYIFDAEAMRQALDRALV